MSSSKNEPIYGLGTIAEPEDAIVDIVFVHGLTGNRETTWTHKETGVFWPQALLPTDIPDARIFTFGYDADVVRLFRTVGSNPLRDHGNSLAMDLAMRRYRTRSIGRPLIFAAHSLGGLVVEQALLIARGSPEEHTKDVLESASAIAFMGTPHTGSSSADLAGPLTRLSNMLRKTNSEIVDVLKPNSEMLAGLQQEFHTMLENRRRNHQKSIEIFCFYEEVAVVGVGMIVPKHSAILTSYPLRSIHANHSEMTKFSGPKDPGYISVSDQLWHWVDKLQKVREEQGAAGATPQSPEPRAQGQANTTLGVTEDTFRGQQHFGAVYSGGGPVFQGSQSAGRDFNVTSRQL